MTHPVPDPVLHFFERFLVNPDYGALRSFCVNLLELEVDRATHELSDDPQFFEVTDAHLEEVKAATSMLAKVLREDVRDFDKATVQFHWLTLLGHRLGVERGLPVGGIEALAHVGACRLSVPLTEAEAWSCDGLFNRYTETVLRSEWDYHGIQFRHPVSAWTQEKVADT